MTFNIEVEYGGFLDALEARLSELADGGNFKHYGVKGMRWGVRKDRSAGQPELRSLGPDSITRTTPSGETLTLSKTPPSRLHKFLANRSKSWRKEYENNASLVITDSSGKRVGEASVSKVNKDELNLVWLGINRSSRGRGYGTTVMKAAADFGRAEGFKKLTLEVPGASPDARHIYEKLGFKVTKEAESTNDIWGGLTEMEYTIDEVRQDAMTSFEKPSLESLAHYGTKGMKWGVRKKKYTSAEIKGARIRQHGRQQKLNVAAADVRYAKATKGDVRTKKASERYSKAEREVRTNEDRLTAMHMTRGEKVAGVLVTGPIGLVALGGNKIARNIIERDIERARRGS